MPNKVAPVGADLKAPSNDAETEPACDHSLATVQWETACFYMPEPSEPSPKQSGAGKTPSSLATYISCVSPTPIPLLQYHLCARARARACV